MLFGNKLRNTNFRFYKDNSRICCQIKISPGFFSLFIFFFCITIEIVRSNHSEVFLGKGVLKICSKFKGKHTWGSVISIKLQSNFIEITLWHRCSPVNLMHILGTSFFKNTSGWLLLNSFELKKFLLILGYIKML